MIKKLIFSTLLLFLFSFVSKSYAVSPATTYALSGSLTATTSSGIQFFTLSGTSDTITGSNEASGSITYSSGAFSGSITIANTSGNITLSGSGDTISYNGSSITYDSSTNTFSGSIPLSLSETLTTPATCSDGSAPTNGTCSNGAYLTCAESGYTLSGDTCSETVSGSFTLSGSGSNINISGGSSTGSISMTQTEECPTGYTLSSGSCVSNTDAGTTSTFVCTNGTTYQNCDSGSLIPTGSAYLCPLVQMQCNKNEISGTPECSSGYTLQNGECVSNVAPSCPGGYTFSSGECLEKSSPSCPSGYTETNGQCQQGNVGGSVWNIWGQELLYTSGNSIDGDNFWVGSISFNTSNSTFGGTIAYDSNGLYSNMYSGSGSGITGDGGYWSIDGYISYNSSNNTFSGSISGGGVTVTGNGNCLDFSGYGVSGSNQVCMSLHTTAMSCPSGYALENGECVGTASPYCSQAGYSLTNANNTCTSSITPTYSCPSGTELVGDQCVSYSCPLNGMPQGSAPGQNYTCVEPSGSSTYYCSPNICYNNTTNTPVSTPETMPAPQTNNGTVTSSGCSGSIYIFPGQALQCTRNYAEGKNCCSRGKFLLGGDSCSSNSQILAKAIIYDNQYSPTVPVYSGSGDMNTATIASCSQSAVANGCGQQGEAIYLGDYCSLKLPLVGTCLAKTYVFCKFQGLLATIIQAQGRAQLAGGQNPMSWGSVQSPNCSGFTPTQFQELNFANMNLSEYIAVIKNQVSNTLTTPAIDNQIQQTTKSIGNEINQLETGGALTGTTP